MNKPFYVRHPVLLLSGLFLLAAGLPVSKFLTGFSQVLLAVSFLVEGNFREKFERLKNNKAAWIICGIWFMHMIGLIYSEDLHSGIWDARMKTPILVFTLVIASAEPLSRILVKRLLWTFSAAVLLGTLVSGAVLAGIIHRPVNDIRDIFIFHISHIRFALFLCLSVFFMGWQMFSQKENLPFAVKILCAFVILWEIFFLLLAESVTGLAILFTLALPSLVLLGLTRSNTAVKGIILALAVLVPIIILQQAISFLRELNTPHEIPVNSSEKTALGNDYTFYPEDHLTENGYRVWIYVSRAEMAEAWNKRSTMPFDSSDKKSQPLSMTLIRYLTSLGWRKDAAAVNRLSMQDIRQVESGVANYRYTGTSNFKARLMELNWEFQQSMNKQSPSGHSATMRIEFWKAGWRIFRENFWTGVGTGDLQQEYNLQYEKSKSSLGKQWRLRAHNQYLSIALAFGIFGFAYFLFALAYPVFRFRMYNDYLYMIFLGIFLLSMLTEDTLETPAGSSFFAFFNALFLFSLWNKELLVKKTEAPATKIS